MATKTKSVGTASTEPQDPSVGSAEAGAVGHAPSITQGPAPDAPPAVESRRTIPQAPKQTSGNSQAVTNRIRGILQAVGYKRDLTAGDYELAISDIEATPTLKTHPEVAAYKAECLDYLRGKLDVLKA